MTTIQIFAGEDTATARSKYADTLTKLQSEGVRVINFSNISNLDSEINLSSSLFDENIVYAIENLTSKKTDVEKIKHILNQNIACVAYAGDILQRDLKFAWGNIAKINYSSLSVDIFGLLDGIGVLPKKQVIQNLQSLSLTADKNFLLQMLSKRAVELYFASNGYFDTKLAPWQKSKLQKQAVNFTSETLERLVASIYRLELRLRTSNSTLPLLSELNLILLFYLK